MGIGNDYKNITCSVKSNSCSKSIDCKNRYHIVLIGDLPKCVKLTLKLKLTFNVEVKL